MVFFFLMCDSIGMGFDGRQVVAFSSLVIIQICVGVVYKAAGNSDGYKFSPALSLCLSETLKLCLAWILLLQEKNAKDAFSSQFTSLKLTASALGLAFLYSIGNILAFRLFLFVDPGTLSMSKSMSSAVVATISFVVFGKSYSGQQWIALAIQCAGLMQVHLSVNAAITRASVAGLGLVFLSVSLSGVASVWNAHILKPANVNLHAFNFFLYGFGMVFNSLIYNFLEGAKLSFSDGWSLPATGIVVCNSLIGIAISYVYKYSDALVRTWATALATSALYVLVIAFGWGDFRIVAVLLGIVTVFGAAYLFVSFSSENGLSDSSVLSRLTKACIVVVLVGLMLFASFYFRGFVRVAPQLNASAGLWPVPDILVVILMNPERYEDMPLLNFVWSHFFKNIVFCGRRLQKFEHLRKKFRVINLNTTWGKEGHFTFMCTVLAMQIYPNMRGYLHTHDDMLFNFTRFSRMDLSRSFGTFRCILGGVRLSNKKNGAWMWDAPNVPRVRKMFLDGPLIGNNFCGGKDPFYQAGQSDLFFVTQHDKAVFSEVMTYFYEFEVFLEISVPMTMCCYSKDFQPIGLLTEWNMTKRRRVENWIGGWKPHLHTALHPVVISRDTLPYLKWVSEVSEIYLH